MMKSKKTTIPDKRTVDMHVVSDWVEPGSRVLDLGCGRGVLLEYLIHTKSVFGVGVDLDPEKIRACVKKEVPVYHGDITEFMQAFDDQFFDRVICSRTVQELNNPSAVILEGLRVGKTVTIGFVNFGFWKNRVHFIFRGRRLTNEVFPGEWYEARPTHPLSIVDFERFCERRGIHVIRKVFLGGDWRTPCRVFPNLTCGYAIYDLTL